MHERSLSTRLDSISPCLSGRWSLSTLDFPTSTLQGLPASLPNPDPCFPPQAWATTTLP